MTTAKPKTTLGPRDGRLFYLKWLTASGTHRITRYNYSPGGYPQYDCTFAQWRKRCIKFGEANGLTFVSDGTESEYMNQH